MTQKHIDTNGTNVKEMNNAAKSFVTASVAVNAFVTVQTEVNAQTQAEECLGSGPSVCGCE